MCECEWITRRSVVPQKELKMVQRRRMVVVGAPGYCTAPAAAADTDASSSDAELLLLRGQRIVEGEVVKAGSRSSLRF